MPGVTSTGQIQPRENAMSSITNPPEPVTGRIPKCIYCGDVKESFTDNPCQCDGATEARSLRELERQAQIEQAEAECQRRTEREAQLRARASVQVDSGLDLLRREAQREREAGARQAARDARWEAVKDEEISVKEREIARRVAYQDDLDTAPEVGDDYTGVIPWAEEVDTEPGPALLETADGRMVIPAGKVSWMYGLPAGGKSFTDLMASHIAVLKGGRALILDFEDTQATFQKRALTIGFDVRNYADEIHWADSDLITTDGKGQHIHADAIARQLAWLAEAPDPEMNFVAIDAAESSGCPSDGSDVNPWLRAVIKPWKDTAAIGIVDHIPKRSDDRPAGPIGSQRKLAAVDGIALRVTGVPWTRTRGGQIHLTCEKDRTGIYAKDQPVATIVGTWQDVSDGQRAFAYTIEAPEIEEAQSSMADQILELIADAADAGIMGLKNLRGKVQGKNSAKDSALSELENGGYITVTTAGSAKLYTITEAGIKRLSE